MKTNPHSFLRLCLVSMFLVTSSFLFFSYAVPYVEEIEDDDDVDTLTIRYAHQMDSIYSTMKINYHFEYKDYKPARMYDPDYSHRKVYTTAENAERINILIIVKDYIYDKLNASCKQYSDDIYQYAGYTSTIETVHLDTYSQVKDLILSYNSIDFKGVVLVGDIASVEYEEKYEGKYAYWPCDLYYMDLDGRWYDNDSNAIFDAHKGNVKPEIFVSRIMAHTFGLYGSEVDFIKKYFEKDHIFWTGGAPTFSSALAYTSKDWAGRADFGNKGIGYLYGTTSYSKLEEPNYYAFGKADYIHQNQYNYSLIQLSAHSNPSSHRLTNNFGSSDTLLRTNEIMREQTHALSYNLYCCSALNWTTDSFNGYIGGSYLFNNDITLTIVGSTKTGSMLKFKHYYKELSNGESIGDAFAAWFRKAAGVTHEKEDIHWFYGMSIHGDPCIRLIQNKSSKVSPNLYNQDEVINEDAYSLYKVYDMNGQLLVSGKDQEIVNNLPHGLFIVNQITENKTISYKVYR